MSYVDNQLNKGERVVFRTTLHPIVFAAAGLVAFLGLLMLFLANWRTDRDSTVYSTGTLATLLLLLAGLVGGYAAIRYKTSEFAVTTSRVIIKVGLLSRRTIELQLSKVEGILVEQDLLGRLFDFGTLVVGGTGGTKEPFQYIRSPIEFRRQVQQQLDASSQRARTSEGAVADPTSAEPRHERECPFCAERILAKAARCRFCGQSVEPTA